MNSEVLRKNWIKHKLYLLIPFTVSCCQFLKAIILKIFNGIFLAFLPVESKTNILYVNMYFIGNLFFGFGRYCGKVFPEPVIFHHFWAPAFRKNVFKYFFDIDS